MNFNNLKYNSLCNDLEKIGYKIQKHCIYSNDHIIKFYLDKDSIKIGLWENGLCWYILTDIYEAFECFSMDLQKIILYNLDLFI